MVKCLSYLNIMSDIVYKKISDFSSYNNVKYYCFQSVEIKESDVNFSDSPGGGGGYSIYPRVGRCGPANHTLTLFKTNIADFPVLFKTELRLLIPCLKHLKLRLQEVLWLSCCVINGNLMRLVSMPKSTEVNIN